ncbi:MAG: hypothetical protein IJ524_09490 [Bacteroidales bacterium]|nr:hypothetical protein [Bacteroidales bacterium]
MRIFVDPEDDIQYMSFYIKGLIDRYGYSNVAFNRHAFRGLSDADRATRTMRFIVKEGARERRYVIDTNDSYKINESLYEWSDVYGSVNANWGKTPENLQGKLIPLCPSFAVRYTHPLRAWANAALGMTRTRRPKRKYLGCWRRMLQRPQLQEYFPQQARGNYIFHLSTLWQSDEWNRNNEGVNLRRASFIRACRTLGPDIIFEGGLAASPGNPSASIFSDCLSERIPSHTCLNKTKESTLVFNTPAYWDCHGWKLGEYMALGKAILSTPLSNDLPSPLVHGHHIHFTGVTQEEMVEDIKYMLSHPDYRHRMEANVHDYWLQHGTPEASLKLLGI